MDRRLEALYLLALARNFTPARHDLLVSQLGSLEALLDAGEDELRKLKIPGGALTRLIETRRGCDAAAELARLKEQNISLVGWGDADYPELLASLPDAPLLLFCRGNMDQLRHHGIAIVGSRKCSDRGREQAFEFGRGLAELGIPVVSGMALGIDGAAHEGALEVKGPTVAVLGCGVDVVYPPTHHELYDRLVEQGVVISEYAPGTEPLAAHFPQRNRLISGMTRGTLVVEAPMGSGALITAGLAVEQGREVFAVPGPVRSPYVRGCHHLIKRGQAQLVESVDDILVEFGTNRAALFAERKAPAKLQLEEGAAAVEAPAALRGSAPALNEDEEHVLETLSYEGTHINQVVRKLGITTSECIAHLTMLEIRGLISSASGGYYVRL
ncbi:DNA-protecting protein DprA [bacterium]|nr:DNA-protecting protein DprA [bacterium]